MTTQPKRPRVEETATTANVKTEPCEYRAVKVPLSIQGMAVFSAVSVRLLQRLDETATENPIGIMTSYTSVRGKYVGVYDARYEWGKLEIVGTFDETSVHIRASVTSMRNMQERSLGGYDVTWDNAGETARPAEEERFIEKAVLLVHEAAKNATKKKY